MCVCVCVLEGCEEVKGCDFTGEMEGRWKTIQLGQSRPSLAGKEHNIVLPLILGLSGLLFTTTLMSTESESSSSFSMETLQVKI